MTTEAINILIETAETREELDTVLKLMQRMKAINSKTREHDDISRMKQVARDVLAQSDHMEPSLKAYTAEPFIMPVRYKATLRFANTADTKRILTFEARSLEEAQAKTVKWIAKQLVPGTQIHCVELGRLGKGQHVAHGSRYKYKWRKKVWVKV